MPNRKAKQSNGGETSVSGMKATYNVGLAEQIAGDRRDMEETLVRSSAVYATLVEQMGKVYGGRSNKDGLDQTQRILIALAMAVQNGSESAVEWTITRALNHGAKEQMIKDAIDIALLNGGTFTISNARFAYSSLALRQLSRAGSPKRLSPGDLVTQPASKQKGG